MVADVPYRRADDTCVHGGVNPREATVQEPGQRVSEVTASSAAHPAQMKADPASFLGRVEELELIRQLLVGGTARLLTLTGPAGVGKTRLAHEAGQRCGDLFPAGVWFVDLTAIR